MRRYADPVEVRQGPLDDDARGLGAQGATEGPQQFLWRGRLWKVRAVLAHWVETGAPTTFVLLSLVSFPIEAAAVYFMWHRDTGAYLNGTWGQAAPE